MAKIDYGRAAKKYIRDVTSGRIVAGLLVRLAVQRHLRDLKDGHKRGLYFDPKAAGRVIRFCGFLKHSKGEWAGQRFELEPWQAFIVWCIFGWKNADGTRRFRVAYCELARKNGKSTLAAAIGLYLFFADGEAGAEVYTAATKREQARIVHSEAVRMVKKSPPLKSRIRIFKDNLHVENTASKFEPLGADDNTMDGLNVHGGLIDELHQHRTRGVWDSLDTATGSRRQPLIFSITTAGFNRHSVCWEERDYTIKALEAACGLRSDFKIDDTRFGFIATLDEGDDWKNKRVWIKANPNLGVSVKAKDLAAKVATAIAMVSQRNAVLTKRMNVWTDQQTAWLNTEKWNACSEPVDIALLAGRTCFGGLDLSSKIDLTSFVLVFPPTHDDRLWRIYPQFWIPEETAAEHEASDRVPYREWQKAGLINFTPGNVVDYSFIEEAVIQAAGRFDLVSVGYDSWNATQTAVALREKEIDMQEFIQGTKSFSEPCKEFERLIVAKKIAHGNHKVLNWNAACVSVKTDANGNIRPVKPPRKEAGKRIDGIVGTVMGIGIAIRKPEEQPSIYETQGIDTI